MTLELNGLVVRCVIGDLPEERDRLQDLRADIALEIGDDAALSDELHDTVDYAALSAEISRTLVAAKCKLVERAAKIALDVCLNCEGVRSARVKVVKFGAVANLDSASVTIEGKK